MTFQDAPRRTLADQVYEALERDILSGKYRDGELLSENRISQETGASRTPVREALRRLETEGLTQTLPNRGVAVRPVTAADARDIYEIRMRVEGLAARRAASSAGSEDVRVLFEVAELQEFYASRSNAEQLKILDTQFHEEIYRLCGSEYLMQMLRDMHRRIQRFRKLSMQEPGRISVIPKEHRSIAEAIRDGDPDRAERLMIAHIHAAAENLTNIIDANESEER